MAERLGTGLQHPSRGFESLCHLEKPGVCRAFCVSKPFITKSILNLLFKKKYLGVPPTLPCKVGVGCFGTSPPPDCALRDLPGYGLSPAPPHAYRDTIVSHSFPRPYTLIHSTKHLAYSVSTVLSTN
jgi:hypothetical protein